MASVDNLFALHRGGLGLPLRLQVMTEEQGRSGFFRVLWKFTCGIWNLREPINADFMVVLMSVEKWKRRGGEIIKPWLNTNRYHNYNLISC